MKRFFSFFLALCVTVGLLPGRPALAQAEDPMASAYYGIDLQTGVIGQIPLGTGEDELLSRVFGDGELSVSDGIKTGSCLNLSRDGAVVQTLALAVQADCNGDGIFSVSDLLMVKSVLLGMQSFSVPQTAAADVSGDGTVSVTDFLQMKSQILGLSQFSQRPGSYPGPSVVLSPGETWEITDTAEPVTVRGSAVTWEPGKITAVKPGTAMVTGGEQDILVTVCQQPLEISFTRSERGVAPEGSSQLAPVLNQPVSASVIYSVSDPNVLTVDGSGTITPVSQGTAVVTATLLNGRQASQTIHVMPLIENISLSAASLKVKHNGGVKQLTARVTPEDVAEKLIWSSSDPAIATVDANGMVTGLQDGYATITCTSEFGGVSASCRVKVCNLVQVALTFDDGPSSLYTGLVLDMLEKYGVKSTFFMVGNRINDQTAPLLQRMVKDGHELGYHTWAHTYFYNMSASEIKKDFEEFQNKLIATCGQGATVYRAPGGAINQRALDTIPLPHILWSEDTRDWESRNAKKVKAAVLAGLKDGAIILVHDIHKTTYEGVLLALQEMMETDMDVEFLTVTQLLSRNGTQPEAGVTYYKSK